MKHPNSKVLGHGAVSIFNDFHPFKSPSEVEKADVQMVLSRTSNVHLLGLAICWVVCKLKYLLVKADIRAAKYNGYLVLD